MLNRVNLIGRVGGNPTIRDVGSDKVANFALATSEKYTDKTGKLQEVTEWHNIVIWGKLAEIVQKYVQKGFLLYISGKLKTRTWEDSKNSKHYVTEIIADTLKLLGSKSNNASQLSNSLNPDDVDDLPFA